MNSSSYRMNITIPQRLKAQMDRLDEQVNWSAVAAEAFQRKIADVRSEKSKNMTKEKVIDRLRTAGKGDPKGYEAGHEAGRSWAENKALPRHLRNLMRIQEKGFDEVYKESDDPDSPWYAADNFANALCGENLLDDCRAFLKDALGEGLIELMDGEDFARGFFDGACEVWHMVRNEL